MSCICAMCDNEKCMDRIDTGATYKYSICQEYIKYKIEVTVNSQSIENNTSNITVKVWFFRTNQGYTTFGSGTCYCSINGTSYSQAVTSSQKITSSPIALFTKL